MAKQTHKPQQQLLLPELEIHPLPGDVDAIALKPSAANEVDRSSDTSLKRLKPAVSRRTKERLMLVGNTPQAEPNAASDQAPPSEAPAPPPAGEPLGKAPARQGGQNKNHPLLQHAAYLAILAASIVAIIVLVSSARQFAETQDAQRASLALNDETRRQERDTRQAEIHTKAVELFIKYNELMLQITPPPPKGIRRETRYWKESLALSLLDSLTNLTRGNKEWENTIAWALERHLRFIRDQRAACTSYSEAFVTLLEKVMGGKASHICRENTSGD